MHTRKTIDIKNFEKGRVVFLTKGFATYNVRLVDVLDGKVVVEVVELVLKHRAAMQKMGIQKIWIYSQGTRLAVAPEKLWFFKKIEKQESRWRKYWKVILTILGSLLLL